MTYEKRCAQIQEDLRALIEEKCSCVPNMEGGKIHHICLLHPPLKLDGGYASMMRCLLAFFQEMGIDSQVFMDLLWKSGILEIHGRVADIIRKSAE